MDDTGQLCFFQKLHLVASWYKHIVIQNKTYKIQNWQHKYTKTAQYGGNKSFKMGNMKYEIIECVGNL